MPTPIEPVTPVEAAAPVEPPRAEEPARVSRPSMRVGERHEVELEVGLFGDSNFYVGFTENLSDGGVFVATYMTKPIGSRVELAVRLLGLGEPMKLRGEVRWVREPSSSDEVWPGMGIRFEDVGEDDERRIRAFLTQREPLFYDE